MSASEQNRYSSAASGRSHVPDQAAQASTQVRSFGMGRPVQAGMQGAPGPMAHPAGYPASGAPPYQTTAYPAYASGRTMQMPPKKEKRRRRWLVVLIIFLIACLVTAGVLIFLWQGPGKATRQGTAGQLEGKTEDEIQAELDRVVDEGMFNISIANVIQFADGTSEGEVRIENVPGNHYLMRVVIVLDDTGEQIYETDLIEPNYHIQKDALDVDLDAGTYEATALFFAYDMDTEEQVGQAAAKITLIVDG